MAAYKLVTYQGTHGARAGIGVVAQQLHEIRSQRTARDATERHERIQRTTGARCSSQPGPRVSSRGGDRGSKAEVGR